MAKIPKDPRGIFKEITADYKNIFGDDLVGILLYGSAAGDDYRPGKSDINFLIIVTEKGIEDLDRAFSVVRKWRRKNVAVPLFLTENYLKTSLDVFPIEYLNFQKEYVPVYGKDVLDGLVFEKESVRLQCEREIKGKLLILREAFLETYGKGARLKRTMDESVSALAAISEALLHLRDKNIPKGKRSVLKAMAEVFGLDADVFEKLSDIREGKLKLDASKMSALFKDYLGEMRRLAKQVDSLGG